MWALKDDPLDCNVMPKYFKEFTIAKSFILYWILSSVAILSPLLNIIRTVFLKFIVKSLSFAHVVVCLLCL